MPNLSQRGRIDGTQQLAVNIGSRVDAVLPIVVGRGMTEGRYRFREGTLASEGGRMDKHGREIWWC